MVARRVPILLICVHLAGQPPNEMCSDSIAHGISFVACRGSSIWPTWLVYTSTRAAVDVAAVK